MRAGSQSDAALNWFDPVASQVAPGIYRIPLAIPGDGLRAVNCYAIEDGDSLTFVDSGWATRSALDELEAMLNPLGFGLENIHRYLVTHVHRDHLSVALLVRRRFGSRIALGIGERPSVDNSAAGADSSHLSQLQLWGAGHLESPLRALFEGRRMHLSAADYPDQWLNGPVDVPMSGRTLRAVPTPGHTRGHLVFADLDARLLFAGDHVLPHITPSIGFEPCANPRPLQDYLNSLQVVLAMPDLRLLPAHGWPQPGTHHRARELLEHHELRLAATAGAVAADVVTAWRVAGRLTWTRHSKALDDLDLFNQMLAVGETAAHLDVLLDRGLLAASVIGGERIYTTVSDNSA
jgi:glyoxylase-like metal-dependent hydrolase (beta-lactamase superfamily II)